MQCDIISIHLLHVVVLRKKIHWALIETNYRSISDDDRCDSTVVYSFFGLEYFQLSSVISPLKSRNRCLKILINEWSEIFNSNWFLKLKGNRK